MSGTWPQYERNPNTGSRQEQTKNVKEHAACKCPSQDKPRQCASAYQKNRTTYNPNLRGVQEISNTQQTTNCKHRYRIHHVPQLHWRGKIQTPPAGFGPTGTVIGKRNHRTAFRTTPLCSDQPVQTKFHSAFSTNKRLLLVLSPQFVR